MDILSTLFQQRSRRIGLMIPDVVVSERHSDALEVTEHPVERPTSAGTGFIADHAYRRPSEVVMEMGFAGGGSLLDFMIQQALDYLHRSIAWGRRRFMLNCLKCSRKGSCLM